MKFRQFIQSFAINEMVVFNKSGLTVINPDNSHSSKRFAQRQEQSLTLFDLQDIIQSASEDIKKLNKGDDVLVYSNSKERGIILMMKRKNQAIIKTILPQKKQFALAGTKKILTESIETFGEGVTVYLSSLCPNQDAEIVTETISGTFFTWVDGIIWDLDSQIILTK